MSNVIPWSTLWASTSPVPPPRANSHGRSERPTPKGGLILHAIFSVILMTATSGMYNINEAISFPGSLQAYASGWVGSTFVAKLFALSSSAQLTFGLHSIHQYRFPLPIPTTDPCPNAKKVEPRSRILPPPNLDRQINIQRHLFRLQPLHCDCANHPPISKLQWSGSRGQRLDIHHHRDLYNCSWYGILRPRFRIPTKDCPQYCGAEKIHCEMGEGCA
jgi:hypothetical protein